MSWCAKLTDLIKLAVGAGPKHHLGYDLSAYSGGGPAVRGSGNGGNRTSQKMILTQMSVMSKTAQQLCPDIPFLIGRDAKYRICSGRI